MKLKIISDGTNTGTHLIDQKTGERVEQISKISWRADAKDAITIVNVELTNIPVEIVSSAQIDLFEHQAPNWDLIRTKTFQKDIKIISEGTSYKTKIFDKETDTPVAAIQEIEWEATPAKQGATINKIFFDKKDWV